MNLQERSDKRSLALHRVVVRRLRENPELWAIPLQNIKRWADTNGSMSVPQRVWKHILEATPHDDIIKLLLSRSQRAIHLRSSSPFLGIISPEERNRIFERYRIKLLLWAFCDSTKLVIVNAKTAAEAFKKAEKHWLMGQTITPLGALPLNAPSLIDKPIYPFDHILWHANNDFFFQRKGGKSDNNKTNT